jgi:CBS-domain-containing membrane protein
MKCMDIMKKDLKCVPPLETVDVAARRMKDENIGFLPVCDQDMKIQGTLTDRDLAIRIIAEGRPSDSRVKDVMTREVVSCRPEDDLRRAEDLMARHHKSRMMCVDASGRLVGVISLSDIAQHDSARIGDTLRQVTEREARA